MGADNQQERLKIMGWIVGFIDGEGCFSIAIQKSPNTKLGWQVFPEFVVTQGEKSLQALRNVKDFFKCGNIFINKRYDNHKEHLYRYCVRSIKDIKEKIIPFFVENQLQTAKKGDFEIFTKVIEMIEQRQHLTLNGIRKIAGFAQKMNRKKPSKFLASSETIRRTPEKVKI